MGWIRTAGRNVGWVGEWFNLGLKNSTKARMKGCNKKDTRGFKEVVRYVRVERRAKGYQGSHKGVGIGVWGMM